jgi:hypothetical protein
MKRALILVLSLIWAENAYAAGRVVSLQPDADASPCFQIHHGSAHNTAQVGDALEDNDEFIVLRPGCSATLRVGPDYVEGLSTQRSPYHIPGAPIEAEQLVKLLKLDEIWNWFSKAKVRTQSTEGSRKGEDLHWPFQSSPDSPSPVALEQPTILISWSGGASPYKVAIAGPDGRALPCSGRSEATTLRCRFPEKQEGLYEVTLQDAVGRQVTGYFERTSMIKSACAATRELERVTPADRVASALEVLDCGPQWRVQAIQLVEGSAETYPAAHLLQEALRLGLK